MRVLMCATDYTPRPIGGIGVHVAGLAAGLERAGCDVNVVTSADGPPARNVLRMPSLGPPRLEGADPMSYLLSELQCNIALAGVNTSGWRPDIVHCHDFRAGLAGVSLARRFSCPLVVTKHSLHPDITPDSMPPLRQLFFDYILRAQEYVFDEAARIICVSDATKRTVSSMGRDDLVARAVVIPNGTSIRTQKRPAISNRPLRVLFAARMTLEKGADIALDAVVSSRIPVEARFVGDGPLFAELHSVSESATMAASIEFMGALPYDRMAEQFSWADVVVVPSRHDAAPLTVLEGQAAGCLVVGTAVGGIPSQIDDGRTGWLVQRSQADAVAAALQRAAERRDELVRIGEQARRYVLRELTWTAIARKTLGVYVDVLSEASSI
jgi:glycosyltransferase involved in cell wall biosynthesis